ncbi:IdeS/Mac family cysteine endopeptidase, partial [Streptococcus thoraltensis]
MYNKLAKYKIGHFRMWKSGKQWLFGASVLVALAIGSATPVLANETEGAETFLASGGNIEQTTLVQNQEKLVPEVTPAPEVTPVPEVAPEPAVTPELENLNSETVSETTDVAPDLSQKVDNASPVATQEPIADASSTVSTAVEETVAKPEPLKSVKENYTPSEISENQEWAHGVSKPKKEELVWQHEYFQGYYTAPYKDGSQLFDVNKDFSAESGDYGLCSAGVAANMLHWWLENNKEYVEKYLQESAANGVVTTFKDETFDLRGHQNYNGKSHQSPLFDLFKTYFSNRAVYAHRVLDLFFSGYPKASDYAVNKEAEYQEKESKGKLDQRGGFFKDVFEQKVLTSREEVSDYASLGSKIKQALAAKKALAVDYLFSRNRGHVVNVWGAEFDSNGKLTAIYVTDTDDHTAVIDAKDDKPLQSLKRYTVVERDGKAYITNNYDGSKGVAIKNLYTLDLGEQQWKDYFSKSKEDRDKAIRKKIMNIVRSTKNKVELVEATKRPWGGGFSDQDIALLQQIHKAEFSDNEFESLRGKALETLSIMQGQTQWDGRFPSPGQKLPSTGRQDTPSDLIPVALSAPEKPRSTDTEVTPEPAATPESENLNSETVSETTDVAPDLSQEVDNNSPVATQEPVADVSTTTTTAVEETVAKPEPLKSVKEKYTPPTISEKQEWTHGVTKPNKEELVWQHEHFQGYYTAPSKNGNHLFDVNKDYTADSADFGLCSAGVAANMIHWWLVNNKDHVEKYLKESAANGVVAPFKDETIDLREHQNYDGDSHKSQLFDLFKSYFSKAVYTHRVLDIFFNGYPDVRKYEVNNEADYQTKETKGILDRRGGFFKDVFKQKLLTSLEDVSDYASLGNKIKQALAAKKALAVDYLFNKYRGHVVNVWGAEFDENDQLKALYVTDTDDYTSVINGKGETLQSLKRYTVVNRDGKAYISNNYSDRGGVAIRNLYTLDLGEQQWQNYFSKSKEDRDKAIREKIMRVVRSTKNKAELVEATKQPWGGGFSDQDIELLQKIHKADFSDDEFESVRGKALDTLSVIQGQTQWDGRFPSPGLKLPIPDKQDIPSDSTPVAPSVPETPTESTPVAPSVPETPTESTPVAPSVPDTSTASTPVVPSVPESPRSTDTHVGPKTELISKTPTASTPVVPSVPETPRSTDTHVGPKTELISLKPTASTPVVPSVPESPRSTDTHVGPKTELTSMKPTESTPVVPNVPEQPRSTDTHVGPKTELKVSSGRSDDSSIVRVVPSTDSEVTVGPKSEIIPKVPSVTPEQPDTEVGTKTELTSKTPTASTPVTPSVPETPTELTPVVPSAPETPRSTDTHVGPKTELKVSSVQPDDSSIVRVVPSTDSEVTVGPKSEIIPKVPSVTPEQSDTEVGPKTELTSKTPTASTPVAPSVPDTPHSNDTAVGSKPDLKVSSGQSDDSSIVRVVPSTDSEVTVGTKSEIIPQTPSVTPEQPTTEVGPKPELTSMKPTVSTPVIPSAPENPRSTDSEVTVGTKSEIVPQTPSVTPEQPTTEVGPKPELTSKTPTELTPVVPSVPEQPRSTDTHVGSKPELISKTPTASTPVAPSVPETPHSTDTAVGSKPDLKVSSGQSDDSSIVRVVPSTDSEVTVGTKSEIIPQTPSVTPEQPTTEIGPKTELTSKTPTASTPVAPSAPETPRSTDSEVTVGPKSEIIPQTPSVTPEQPTTEVGPKPELTSKTPTASTPVAPSVPETSRSTDSEVTVGPKSEIIPQTPSVTPEQPTTEVGPKTELTSKTPTASIPVAPSAPENPRSTDTAVGSKPDLKVSSGQSDDSSIVRVVPSTDSEVTVGTKSEIIPQTPSVTPEQPDTEVGTKPELTSMKPTESTPVVPNVPEQPRSTDTHVGPKTELISKTPTVSTPVVPSTPEQPDTETGTKTDLTPESPLTDIKDSNVAIDAKSEVVVQSPSVTPVQPTAEVGTKSELMPDSSLKDDNASTVTVDAKSEVVVQSPSVTPVQATAEVGTKSELMPDSSLKDGNVSTVTVGAKSEVVPQSPIVTPEKPDAATGTKTDLTPDTPLTDIKDSNVAIDAKSEVVVQSPSVTPVQATAEVGTKSELMPDSSLKDGNVSTVTVGA